MLQNNNLERSGFNKEDKDGENKKNTANDTWSYNDILGSYYSNSNREISSPPIFYLLPVLLPHAAPPSPTLLHTESWMKENCTGVNKTQTRSTNSLGFYESLI